MPSPVEAALARHRVISIVALLLLAALAWGWLLYGAGMGMEPLFSLTPPVEAPAPAMAPSMSPSMAMPGMPMDMTSIEDPPTGPPWSAAQFALTASMWWIMMVAMMLPSAAPTVLLYGRAASGNAQARPSSSSFVVGYLAIWGGFSLLAALLQGFLEHGGLLSPMLMASASRQLSGAVLLAAGLYQLTPLKTVCLRHCRNPAQFLSRHYQPGSVGALRMGVLHGAWCVGCCWLLMALLFVGGVMNLAWIALLTLMVAAEKLLPFGRWVAMATGVACLAWGAILLVG